MELSGSAPRKAPVRESKDTKEMGKDSGMGLLADLASMANERKDDRLKRLFLALSAEPTGSLSNSANSAVAPSPQELPASSQSLQSMPMIAKIHSDRSPLEDRPDSATIVAQPMDSTWRTVSIPSDSKSSSRSPAGLRAVSLRSGHVQIPRPPLPPWNKLWGAIALCTPSPQQEHKSTP